MSATATPRRRTGHEARTAVRKFKPPIYRDRYIAAPKRASVIATRLFAPILQDILDEINAEVGMATETTEFGVGAQMLLASRAKMFHITANGDILPVSPAGVGRRIRSILKNEGRATKVEIVDALMLAADRRIEESDLLTLPAGIPAALERIRLVVEYDAQGRTMSEETMLDLAEDLLEFSLLVIHGPEEFMAEQDGDVIAA